MGDEIEVVRHGGALATPTLDELGEYVKKPLRQLPAEWRALVWDFWCFWSHLLPTQLALATRLRQWRAQGVTLEQMAAAFEAVNRPERAASINFAGELLSALATELLAPDLRRMKPELRAVFLRQRAERAEREGDQQ